LAPLRAHMNGIDPAIVTSHHRLIVGRQQALEHGSDEGRIREGDRPA
jgi:hypothetical protein